VAGSSGGACVKMLAGSKSVTAGGGLSAAAAAASAAFVAAKLGLSDQLESAVAKTPGLACLRDAEGRCCLHYAAGYGHEVNTETSSQPVPVCRPWLPSIFTSSKAFCFLVHQLQPTPKQHYWRVHTSSTACVLRVSSPSSADGGPVMGVPLQQRPVARCAQHQLMRVCLCHCFSTFAGPAGVC
jgi:hypothetical protein